MSEKSAAPALDRGLSILELAMAKPEGCSFGDVSDALALSPASTNRFLKVLVERGYLMKKPGATAYVLGEAVDRLAGKTSMRDVLAHEGVDRLAALRSECENTAVLFHWDGQRWECVGSALHEHSIVMQSVGEIRTDILNYPWSAFIWGTMTKADRKKELLNYAGRKQLKKELSGDWEFGVENGFIHVEDRIHRITAPIQHDRLGLIGAVAVGLPGGPIKKWMIQEMGNHVKQTAATLSAACHSH